MITRTALAGSLLVAAQAAAADNTPRIDGTVWEGSSQAVRVSIGVVPGKPARVFTRGGHELEASLAADGSMILRLLDSAGNQLHSATTPTGQVANKSFRYAVCGAEVSYVSPEPAEIPVCAEG